MAWYDNAVTFVFYLAVAFFITLLIKYVWDYL